MENTAKVSEEQIRKMKHAIGLDNSEPKRGKYNAYRNYYFVHHEDEDWDTLVDIGLAKKSRVMSNGQVTYFVSEEGIEFIASVMGIKITIER